MQSVGRYLLQSVGKAGRHWVGTFGATTATAVAAAAPASPQSHVLSVPVFPMR